MSRPSKIDRLPPEIREEIGSLRERGYTIDEILGHLRAFEIAPQDRPSRSGLHRHIQGLDKISERLMRSRSVAEALVRKHGDAPEGRQARLNIEIMHSIVMDLLMAAGDQDGEAAESGAVTFDPQQVSLLGRTLRDLSSASKTDADLITKLREEQRKLAEAEMKKRVDVAMVAVGKEKGLSADTIDMIKSQMLGIRGG